MKEPAPLDNPEEHRTPTLDCQEETVLYMFSWVSNASLSSRPKRPGFFLAPVLWAPGRAVEGSWQSRSVTKIDGTQLTNHDHPPFFSTPIHTFAQTFSAISIDAPNRFHYLPRQIELKSLKALWLRFEGAAA
jgi:hypothetical protein